MVQTSGSKRAESAARSTRSAMPMGSRNAPRLPARAVPGCGAKLPRIDLAAPRSAIGKGTVDAIRSGIVFGFAAQVDGIITRIRDELGTQAPTIATGGLAATVVPSTTTIDEVDDLLTLTGLRLLYEHNV